MLIIFTLSVCAVYVVILLKSKPNLFMFRLIEKVFGEKDVDRK